MESFGTIAVILGFWWLLWVTSAVRRMYLKEIDRDQEIRDLGNRIDRLRTEVGELRSSVTRLEPRNPDDDFENSEYYPGPDPDED